MSKPRVVRGDYRHTHKIARRVTALILALKNQRRMPVMSALARDIGVSHRTLYRYLVALEQAGWPLPKRWNDKPLT